MERSKEGESYLGLEGRALRREGRHHADNYHSDFIIVEQCSILGLLFFFPA